MNDGTYILLVSVIQDLASIKANACFQPLSQIPDRVGDWLGVTKNIIIYGTAQKQRHTRSPITHSSIECLLF